MHVQEKWVPSPTVLRGASHSIRDSKAVVEQLTAALQSTANSDNFLRATLSRVMISCPQAGTERITALEAVSCVYGRELMANNIIWEVAETVSLRVSSLQAVESDHECVRLFRDEFFPSAQAAAEEEAVSTRLSSHTQGEARYRTTAQINRLRRVCSGGLQNKKLTSFRFVCVAFVLVVHDWRVYLNFIGSL